MRLHSHSSTLFAYCTLFLASTSSTLLVSGQHSSNSNRPAHHHAALLARSSHKAKLGSYHASTTDESTQEWEGPVAERAGAATPGDSQVNNTEANLAMSILDAGRFGHAAVHLPDDNVVLFIGGQIAHEGTFITNDVVSLDLASETTSQAPAYARRLPPSAWAASALVADSEIWLVGGIAENCSATDDPLALYFSPVNQTGWTPAQPSPAAPQRRKLAQAVALPDQSSATTNLYIWGGVSEPYTCNANVEAYTALDIWSLDAQTVRSMDWDVMFGLSPDWPEEHLPPITDYVALPLPDSEQVIYLGGRTTAKNGQLLYLSRFNRIAMLDTDRLTWSQQQIHYETVPEPREGHVAVYLSDTEILIHGGVAEDGTPIEDTWILDISDWSYRSFSTSSGVDAPKLAWHTATKVSDDKIIFAYGLDPDTGATSNRVFALSRSSGDRDDWTWSLLSGSSLSSVSRPHAQGQPAASAARADTPLSDPQQQRSYTYGAETSVDSVHSANSGGDDTRHSYVAHTNSRNDKSGSPYEPEYGASAFDSAPLHSAYPSAHASAARANPDQATVAPHQPSMSSVEFYGSSATTSAVYESSIPSGSGSSSGSSVLPTSKQQKTNKSSSAQSTADRDGQSDADSDGEEDRAASARASTDASQQSGAASGNKANDEGSAEDGNGKAKTIAGSVAGVVGAAAAIGGLVFLYRRRAGKDTFRVLSVMHSGSGGSPSSFQGAPVSVLQYTRPAPRRMLSLGSAPSADGHGSPPPPMPMPAMGAAAAAEMPEMQRVQSNASVESYPYLQALQRSSDDDDESRSPSIATVPHSPAESATNPFLDPSAAAAGHQRVTRSASVRSASSTLLSYLRSEPSSPTLSTSSNEAAVNAFASPAAQASVGRTASTASLYATTASIFESYSGSEYASSTTVSPRPSGAEEGGATPRLGHQRHESDA